MSFENMEIDPVDGAETMRLLGLGNNDIVDPVAFLKVKDIIDFFKGSVDKRYVINLVAGKPFAKNSDKINHLYNYVDLKKASFAGMEKLKKSKQEYEQMASQMAGIERELKIFER